MGTAGLLNVPSADMHETGTVLIGGNYLPENVNPLGYDTGNYFLGVTLFSFMELTFRPTLLQIDYMNSKPKIQNQDRSYSIRVRALKEGKYMPAVVIGGNEPFGTYGGVYYRSVYLVASKNFSFGENTLQVSVGGYGYRSEIARNRNSVFGGVKFVPAFCRQMSFIAEYDTRTFNLGLTGRLWNRVSLHAFTVGFKSVSGGLRYECVLIH